MSFLSRIAESYSQQYGDTIHKLCFVFPNRRAGLFFRKYLAQTVSHPVFSPRIITIDQLFQELSSLKLADSTDLLFRLYEIYLQEYHSDSQKEESFDDFAFWGRMMLNDFNDVDSNLVDPDKLFTNLSDLKDIELYFSLLGEEQKESIRAFLRGFQQEDSNIYRKKFLHLWRALLPIYKNLHSNLLANGLAYQGMLAREVVEKWKYNTAEERRYVFVGFNALSGTERSLMKKLQDEKVADFCWDYNHLFVRDPRNRASLFMDDNLKLFPNRKDIGIPSETMPHIHLVEIPSSTGQATYLTHILQKISEQNSIDWTRVGIVLPQERLLSSVRRAIPACVSNLNITMGEPLSNTPIYSLMLHLSELQFLCKQGQNTSLFYHRPVLALLSHPFISDTIDSQILSEIRAKIENGNMTFVSQQIFEVNGLLELIFTPQTEIESTLNWVRSILIALVDIDTENPERNEYIYQTILQTNRLADLCKQHPAIKLNTRTLLNLLLGLVKTIRIPFEGEPLAGLQIMGMLESRGMDFTKIIITDVNEDILPGHNSQQSFIPYDLRIAYGLPTPERQDAVFAYNFYRLISCAEEVWLLQDTTADDMRSGEPSRFVNQLLYQYNIEIEKQTISIKATSQTSHPTKEVAKDEHVLSELQTALCPQVGEEKGKGLSASALNTYVGCPLKFYLQYIHHLREATKIDENIGDDVFGTITHSVMEELYQPFCGKTVNISDIDNMLYQVKKTDLIEKTYKLIQKKNPNAILEGKDYLPIHVMRRYLERTLDYDKHIAPFKYISSEMKCNTRIPVDNVGNVYLYGIIDRIDQLGEKVRIIDYKTGRAKCKFNEMESLFSPGDESKESDHVRQTLFYCLLFSDQRKENNEDFYPYIYYMRDNKDFCKEIPATEDGYSMIKESFEQELTKVIKEIFNKDIPFTARSGKNCEYCPFSSVCL